MATLLHSIVIPQILATDAVSSVTNSHDKYSAFTKHD